MARATGAPTGRKTGGGTQPIIGQKKVSAPDATMDPQRLRAAGIGRGEEVDPPWLQPALLAQTWAAPARPSGGASSFVDSKKPVPSDKGDALGFEAILAVDHV